MVAILTNRVSRKLTRQQRSEYCQDMVFLVPKLRIVRRVAITYFAAMLLVGISFAEATGVIEGTVVYTNGVPVIGATVYANRLGAFVSASIVPHASTDGDGHYSLNLPFGRYSLAAGKPEEDYPDALYDTFYHGGWQATGSQDLVNQEQNCRGSTTRQEGRNSYWQR